MSEIPKNIARIQLQPVRFLIEGPPELVTLTHIAGTSSTDPEEAKWAVMDVWQDWYVQCSVSGEYIRLCDLSYWDVDKREVYARPELVPALGWYVQIPRSQ